MKLNDYSTRFLFILVREFPDLDRQLKPTKEAGCFAVFVPTAGTITLHVSTQAFGRIRVAVDRHDVHFGGWIHSDPDEAFADALNYIRAFSPRP